MNTDFLNWTLLGIGGISAVSWCVLHTLGAISLARVFRLSMKHQFTAQFPSLSIVIAACNERSTLETAIESLLSQDYPDLEIVIVDDRSTDGTTDLTKRIADANERVRSIHITELPPGWLGKVNALRIGMEAATGKYVLFTDADVHFSPNALKSAMDLVLAEELDHLTLFPQLLGFSLFHRTLMHAFFVGYVRRTKGSDRLVHPSTPFGYGAFNLVRRDVFERTAGFDWLCMDVLDDLALGTLMKNSGARSGFAVAFDALKIEWYPSLWSTISGFEKNMVGGLAGYRFGFLLAMVIGCVVLAVGPLLIFFSSEIHYVWPLPLLALGCLVGEAVVARRQFGLALITGLLTPVTHLLAAYILLRGGLVCYHRGGVTWRGTFYPLQALRAGRRVSFP